MNSVILHLLESIKTEPDRNSGVLHVYYWGQWHIMAYHQKPSIFIILLLCYRWNQVPGPEGTAYHQWECTGTGWVTVGCTRNIWKNCWENVLAIPFLYYCIFFSVNKYCFLLNFLSYGQPEIKLKRSTV